MTKHDAFLRQAESDLCMYDLLVARDRTEVPECHPLHYLQMASEKLAKAYLFRMEPGAKLHDHRTFTVLHGYLKRPEVAELLGYDDADFDVFRAWWERARDLFESIEQTCPSGYPRTWPKDKRSQWRNVEYPWRGDTDGVETHTPPVDHDFGLLEPLRETVDGADVVKLIHSLIREFEALSAIMLAPTL